VCEVSALAEVARALHACKLEDRAKAHVPLVVMGLAPVKLMPVPTDRPTLVTVPLEPAGT